ncbi:hypothetical protein ENSA5_15000 [Enhygromyxa salina]|uniref:Uncharacterized protein n=1 Tax=Enhygromyxa salina TaxID=215803 RepID=A0A2S9YEC6_9BACT|nr:hypothetical protein [Enhygromyxa salina]PRQ03470.1 hypothetical protein ENSA5_15000 [Enhygromyxa salina]
MGPKSSRGLCAVFVVISLTACNQPKVDAPASAPADALVIHNSEVSTLDARAAKEPEKDELVARTELPPRTGASAE